MKWMCMVIVLLLPIARPVYADTAGTLSDWYAREHAMRVQIEHDREQTEQREKIEKAQQGAIDKGRDVIKYGVGTVISAKNFRDNWQALSQVDETCAAGYAESGPTVPSHCAESSDCRACYESAVKSIQFDRTYLERARCITASTLKMAKSAVAFGDSVSGINGYMGLAWQLSGKPPIEKATAKLKKTYESKASGYLNGLDHALKKLGECEAQYFGERDWYQRYGWIYMEYMKAQYESPPWN